MPVFENETISLQNSPTCDVDLNYNSPSSTFKFQKSTFSTENLKPNEIAVKTLYISHDPTQRGWMQKDQDKAKTYRKPILENDPIACAGLGEVIATGSEVTLTKKGDIISSVLTWQKYCIITEKSPITIIDVSKNLPLYYYLTIFGLTSLTAWAGLAKIARIEPTDILIVNAASGATGNIVVQLAKKVFNAKKVIGVTSSPEKCRFVESLGADSCLNYNDSDFSDKLLEETGDSGASLLWDNVGGILLDKMLSAMGQNGRVVACGSISGYNDHSKLTMSNWPIIITKRLTVKGFIVLDYKKDYAEAIQTLATGLITGKIIFEEGKGCNIEDATGENFRDLPKTWIKLFSKTKPTGKILSVVSK